MANLSTLGNSWAINTSVSSAVIQTNLEYTVSSLANNTDWYFVLNVKTNIDYLGLFRLSKWLGFVE